MSQVKATSSRISKLRFVQKSFFHLNCFVWCKLNNSPSKKNDHEDVAFTWLTTSNASEDVINAIEHLRLLSNPLMLVQILTLLHAPVQYKLKRPRDGRLSTCNTKEGVKYVNGVIWPVRYPPAIRILHAKKVKSINIKNWTECQGGQSKLPQE